MDARMGKMNARTLGMFVLAAAAVGVACTGKKSTTPTVASTVPLSGVVLDWHTHQPVAGVTISSQDPPIPGVTSAADGTFTLPSVPINGYLILQATATGYVTTVSQALLVQQQPITGVKVEIVSNASAATLTSGYAVTSTSGRGHVVGRTTNLQTGGGLAGVSALELLPVTFQFDGPHFLASTDSASSLTATSSSGGFAYFNVTVGNVAVQASAPGFVFQQQGSVVQDGDWTVFDLAGDGSGGPTPTPTPTGVPVPHFAADVYPIFAKDGCAATNATGCHYQGANGKPPTSTLTLGGPSGGGHPVSMTDVYNNIITKPNVIAVVTTNSLLLTKPLIGGGTHGGGDIFLNTMNPDYQTLLNWINERPNTSSPPPNN